MNITFSSEAPDAQSFKNLYDTTNWGPIERDVGFYADALRGSWASIAAYDRGKLVAFVRAISDGKLHAFITEMIVAPEYQRRGLGEQLLKLIVERCHSSGVSDIQLFCAKGKAAFYLKNGFSSRPDDAPGMQYCGALANFTGNIT
jgi:GNAT superfamily N-acetyltransferase